VLGAARVEGIGSGLGGSITKEKKVDKKIKLFAL
jgi:hypothetical protein